MKAWRRSGGLGTATAVAVPQFLSVQADGGIFCVVTFTSPVVLTGTPNADLLIDSDVGIWSFQIDPVTLLWESLMATPHNPGEPWSDIGPESDLAPQPLLPASGLTTA